MLCLNHIIILLMYRKLEMFESVIIYEYIWGTT